jgi:hypothetical protein
MEERSDKGANASHNLPEHGPTPGARLVGRNHSAVTLRPRCETTVRKDDGSSVVFPHLLAFRAGACLAFSLFGDKKGDGSGRAVREDDVIPAVAREISNRHAAFSNRSIRFAIGNLERGYLIPSALAAEKEKDRLAVHTGDHEIQNAISCNIAAWASTRNCDPPWN